MSESTRAIITGKLKLTREQENRLLQCAINRRQTCLTEMGWISSITAPSRSSQPYDGWLDIRHIAWSSYGNDFSYRQNTAKFGALFRLFNSSVNVPKRAVRMFKARAADAILNTDPWIGMKAEGEEDEDPAVKFAARFLTRKFSDNGVKDALREATEQAAVSGESVVKICRKRPKSGPSHGRIWIAGGGQAMDAVSGASAQVPESEVTDTSGGRVTEHDTWEPDADIPGVERLKRDPQTKKPQDAHLSDAAVPLHQKHSFGELDVTVIPYQDFICSPNAASLQDADYREHSLQWEEGLLRSFIAGYPTNPDADEWLRFVHQGDTKNKVESQRPKVSNGRWWNEDPGGIIPKGLYGESWMRFDLNDDGEHIIEVCLLWDVKNEFPIGYDYAEEVSGIPDELPFKVIRIIPEKNRWYGVGFYELLSNEHEFIDRQWNRIDSRSSTSGVFKWHVEDSIVEVERNIPLEFNSPRVYTIRKDVESPDKALGFTELPKMDDNIWQMLTQCTQNAQTMSGTMQPSDSANSDLNQSNTLGEQELLNQEADVINGDIIQDLLSGITEVIRRGAWVVFKNFDIEFARLLMGAERADQLEAYLAPHMNDLLYTLKPTLTKQQNKQQMASIQQALTILVGDGVPWTALVAQNPAQAKILQPLYERSLAIHDIENPSKLLVISPAPMPQPGTMPQSPDATAQPFNQPPPALPAPAPL